MQEHIRLKMELEETDFKAFAKFTLCYTLADYVNCHKKLTCQNPKENTHVSSPHLSNKRSHQMAVWM